MISQGPCCISDLLCNKSPQNIGAENDNTQLLYLMVSKDLELGRGLAGVAHFCSMVLELQLEDSKAREENHRQVQSRVWGCALERPHRLLLAARPSTQ